MIKHFFLYFFVVFAFYVKANEQAPLPADDQQEATEQEQMNQSLYSDEQMYQEEQRDGLLLPSEATAQELLPISDDTLAPPYGANLFAGGYETERFDGLTPDYLVSPGDKLSIWLWGAVNEAQVVTVDNQGNIFIPSIGPIKVANVPASQVNAHVTKEIKSVYKNNVNIYVNLLTATPVSVYITGAIVRPGQYAGLASDSILYYLKRAGGIDSERGNYRAIEIIREQKVVQEIDLYEFLKIGNIANFQFKDGDAILVKEQGKTINVQGKVRSPFRFEFKENQTLGKEIINYVRPYAKVSHVGVTGSRDDLPFFVYLTLEDFKIFTLEDGDKIYFNNDIRNNVIDVKISGSYVGPSYFAIEKGTRLFDLLDYVQVDQNLSNFKSVYILRDSVAKEQDEMLDESLDRLERSVFTAPASSNGEAAIRSYEANLVSQFITKNRDVESLGKVILSENGNIANILLEKGDEIVIPQKTDLVQVGGEVIMPQAVVYNPNAKIEDYVAWAGGYTERANYKRIAVIKANGMVEFNEENITKGDQILVLPRVDSKNMQLVTDLTQIMYQMAVAASVVQN